MNLQLQPGYRVIWHTENALVKAQVERVYKTKARILTTNFEKVTVAIEDLEIAPHGFKTVGQVERERQPLCPSCVYFNPAHDED